MSSTEAKAGRPRSFDEDEILDLAVDAFWRCGNTQTTTRLLETELGMTQSSIYNTFGSKRGLLERSLDRYFEQLDEALVRPLDKPGAGIEALIAFVDALVQWVTVEGRPGCLLLNLLSESGPDDEALVERARLYRERVRQIIGAPLASLDPAQAATRTELTLATLLGINIAARGGASVAEVSSLADALKTQLRSWSQA